MSKLVEPSLENRDAFLSMAEEWRAHGDDRYALALDDFTAYLRRLQRLQRADQLPPGWVPGAEFWIDDAEQIVACVRLRFWLNHHSKWKAVTLATTSVRPRVVAVSELRR